jgi:hypothetical protein
MPYAPRAHLMPLFYSDGQPAADIEILPEIKVRNDYLIIIFRIPYMGFAFAMLLKVLIPNFKNEF